MAVSKIAAFFLCFSLLLSPLSVFALDATPPAPQETTTGEGQTTIESPTAKKAIKVNTTGCVSTGTDTKCTECDSVKYQKADKKTWRSCYEKVGACTRPEGVKDECEAGELDDVWANRKTNSAEIISPSADFPSIQNHTTLSNVPKNPFANDVTPALSVPGTSDIEDAFPGVYQDLIIASDALASDAEAAYRPFVGGTKFFSLDADNVDDPSQYLTHIGGDIYQSPDGTFVSLPKDAVVTEETNLAFLGDDTLKPLGFWDKTIHENMISFFCLSYLNTRSGCDYAHRTVGAIESYAFPLFAAVKGQDAYLAGKRGDWETAAINVGEIGLYWAGLKVASTMRAGLSENLAARSLEASLSDMAVTYGAKYQPGTGYVELGNLSSGTQLRNLGSAVRNSLAPSGDSAGADGRPVVWYMPEGNGTPPKVLRLTDDISYAAAQGDKAYPVYLNPGKTLTADAQGARLEDLPLDFLKQQANREGDTIIWLRGVGNPNGNLINRTDVYLVPNTRSAVERILPGN